MCNDLLYAAGKVVVKDRKQYLNAFFTMSLRNRKFEISCCVQDSSHPDDLFQSRYVNPGFKPFSHFLEYKSVISSITGLFSLLTT